MANLSRSPSLLQPRNASPLRKNADPGSHSPKFSSPSDSHNKSFRSKHFSFEKENEQDPPASTTKGRSPMTSSSPKGSPFQKNFMAPTISASSKAVGPSFQRKRVLGERNEMVKSSSIPTEEIAGPTVNFQLTSTQVEETTNCSCISSICSPQIKEAASPFELGLSKTVSPSIGPETTTQKHQLQSTQLPPYDPKVNYLSPRPQFLHYKPKPRGGLSVRELDFLETDSDSISHEDSSSSEGSNDAISVQTEDKDNLSKEATVPQVESPKIELHQNRVTSMWVKLKIRHVLLVLLISCICIPLSDSPLIATHANPNVPLVRFVGFYMRLLNVSNNLHGWLSECFSHSFAREKSFPRKINSFPLANLTCMVSDNSNINDVTGEEREILSSFDMEHRKNEAPIRYGIGKLEEEVEEEEVGVEKEEEEIVKDVGHASEMVTSSFISEMKGDETQFDMFEKSDLEMPEIPEPELVEHQEVNDLDAIMLEDPEHELKEPETANMSDEEQINISRKATQTVAPIAVLLSLVTAIVVTFAKKKNQVLLSDSICEDKTPELAQGSSESHVPNKNSLHQNSTLDIEFSRSSFEVGTDDGIYTSTPRERQARRESEASSGSYGSYMSFEKISSKKRHGEGEEMITPVRRSSRLRDRTISS